MHAYDKQGNPVYEVPTKPGAKNPTRPTEVRDMIALDLVPSVTEVDKAICKNTFLDKWLREQIGLWAYENRPEPDESAEEYAARAMQGGSEKGFKAADKGTLIHDAIEHYLINGEWPDCDISIHGYFTYAERFISDHFDRFIAAEKAIASVELGVGGKVDCVADSHIGDGEPRRTIFDWKTQDVKWKKLKAGPVKNPAFYDSWPRQLALYSAMDFLDRTGGMESHFALLIANHPEEVIGNLPRIVSVVIDSNEPCDFTYKVWSRDEQMKALGQMLCFVRAFHALKFKPKGCVL